MLEISLKDFLTTNNYGRDFIWNCVVKSSNANKLLWDIVVTFRVHNNNLWGILYFTNLLETLVVKS